MVFNNRILLQFGIIHAVTTTLPLSYPDPTYKIYLGFVTGTDGCWYTTGKTISSFTQMEKHYTSGYVNSSMNNYYLTLGFISFMS